MLRFFDTSRHIILQDERYVHDIMCDLGNRVNNLFFRIRADEMGADPSKILRTRYQVYYK